MKIVRIIKIFSFLKGKQTERKKERKAIFVFSKTYGNVLVLDNYIQCTERDEFAYGCFSSVTCSSKSKTSNCKTKGDMFENKIFCIIRF